MGDMELDEQMDVIYHTLSSLQDTLSPEEKLALVGKELKGNQLLMINYCD